MSYLVRKYIAVLLAVWLPLFSGSALAASVSMQMPHGACQDMAAMQDDQPHSDQSDDQQHSDQHDSSCSACGVCHLACSGYLGVQQINGIETMQSVSSSTPYLFSFHSITSTPLVPPPLA